MSKVRVSVISFPSTLTARSTPFSPGCMGLCIVDIAIAENSANFLGKISFENRLPAIILGVLGLSPDRIFLNIKPPSFLPLKI